MTISTLAHSAMMEWFDIKSGKAPHPGGKDGEILADIIQRALDAQEREHLKRIEVLVEEIGTLLARARAAEALAASRLQALLASARLGAALAEAVEMGMPRQGMQEPQQP